MPIDPHDAMAFVAEHTLGVLMTIKPDGRPQASCIVYGVFDDQHEVRISVTDDRVKTRNIARDPRVSMHVQGSSRWSWVVVEGNALLSPVAQEPGDATTEELRRLYVVVGGEEHPDWDEFDRAMVEERRRVIAFRPDHAYGQVPD